MDRHTPRAISDEIDLYIRTYYSLLRSSGDVRVRAFEEAHLYSRSSLHLGAENEAPDLAAFAYSAARLPECMPQIRRIVLGQSFSQFSHAGLPVDRWQIVRTRGRRRPLRWDGGETLAVFVASASDIDDLVPIVTAYQLEWNKIRARLLGTHVAEAGDPGDSGRIAAALDIDVDDMSTLRAALGPRWRDVLDEMRTLECDLFVRLLDGSFREYQRQAQNWWSAIDPALAAAPPARSDESRPVYFVSSNSHSLANLVGGYAHAHRDDIVAFLRRVNPEGLAERLDLALDLKRDEHIVSSILYYSLRAFLHEGGRDAATTAHRLAEVKAFDAAGGMRSLSSPGRIDVDAQVIDLAKVRPDRMDPRLRVEGDTLLAKSNAVIVNIDYPLGMAAYHHLSAIALGVDEIRGVYIMGKAATLNGRVGDVMISKVVHDEHSSNTYLFRNALTQADVQPFMRQGTILDNQKALTVRSAFLQNRDYMDVFYREGYTVLEMEAGPYLSAVYETTAPQRHPRDEIVNLTDHVPFELFGVVHYASDTPYSRRQSLLSKSLSFFGVVSTYGCAIAIARRIFAQEIERVGGPRARR